MVLSKFFLQNLIKLYTKTHQIAPLKKISGGMPPNPLSFATCKLPNLRKKIIGPRAKFWLRLWDLLVNNLEHLRTI